MKKINFGSKELEGIGGYYNMALGNNALNNITTGSFNLVIGVNSGGGITTGNWNIIIGNNIPGENINNQFIVDNDFCIDSVDDNLCKSFYTFFPKIKERFNTFHATRLSPSQKDIVVAKLLELIAWFEKNK